MRYYKYEFIISGGDGDMWEHTEIRTTRFTQEWITQQWLKDTLADLKRDWPQMDDQRLDVNINIYDIADGEENTLGRLHIQQAANGVITDATSAIQEF